ncbi:MAG: DUF1294 domain-containing protein [Clostridia bacterium]|nr:DUF1294 domain-containing protein [Clostridia bacterium]
MDKSAYILIWLGTMSIIAVIMTVYDKRAARKGRSRISEKALMLEAFFGGATAMYTTMQIIRHKTKHTSFMVGLPIFIIVHIALIVAVVFVH